jgi:hypothetical protein
MEAMRSTLPVIWYRERVTSWATVMISASLAACSSRTPTARERALAELPADARVIASADGPSLASAGFRRVIDANRAILPPDLGCVIDTALTSEGVAVAIDPRIGTTIVIVTRAFVGNCPALSKLASDRYVATIGGGSLVTDRTKSVLGDSQWRWAREYLVSNPIAIAAELPAERVLAVAQPDPVDGWVAIDALEPTTIDKQLGELGARWRAEGKTQLGTKLRTSRSGAQVIARLEKPDVDDLIALVNDLARNADAPTAAPAPAFSCPPPSALIETCTPDHVLITPSPKEALEEMTRTEVEPFIDGGSIVGIRLLRDAPLILRAGDIIVGIDSRRVGSRAQLEQLVATVGKRVALAIRRDGVDLTIGLSEQ